MLVAILTLAIAVDPDVQVVDPPPAGKWCEFKSDTGKQLVLRCPKATEWALVDETAQLTALGEQAVFSASAPARYRLVAVADGKLVKIAVTVGGAPTPPQPPPPNPVDVLKTKLKAAIEADSAAPDDVQKLAALYRQAAKTAIDPGVPSTAELLRRVREAGVSLVGADVLRATRGVAAVELRAALGKSTDEAITDTERKAAASLFARLAEILEAL